MLKKSMFLVGLTGGVVGQCTTGSPLLGRLGARLFCGVGERSVTCPVGSACLLPAGVCCPVLATTTTVVTPAVTAVVTPVVTPVVPVVTPPAVIAKCQFGSPWKNALGVEYDCGPGVNHADCPVGSQCITGPNGVYHSCCAISAATVPPATTTATTTVVTLNTAAPATTALVAKCQFGSPLKNAAGIDLFCGAGANRVDCPLNSQCIFGPNNAFAACCAISASASATFIATMSNNNNMNMNNNNNMMQQNMNNNNNMMQWNQQQSSSSSESSSWENSNSDSSSDNNSTVRFLTIKLLDATDALAFWAPPAENDQVSSYLAELSYDANNWNQLKLEQPSSTFAEFPVNQQQSFQVRVTPQGGSPSTETFNFQQQQQQQQGKAGKMGGKMGKAGKNGKM